MLPKIPYSENGTQYQILNQRGLNLSESASDGELSDSYGVTTDNFPTLTQRKKRKTIGAYARPTAIYYWDGLLVVDGTDLYYKGDVVGTVLPGEKQFAVVNTQLVVWPDKKILDLRTGKLRRMDGSITTIEGDKQGGGTRFTENTITITSSVPVIGKEVSDKVFSSETPEKITVYTALTYDKETQTWIKTPSTGIEKTVESLANGDLTIPSKNEAGGYTLRTRGDGEYPDAENTDGVYYKVTKVQASTRKEYRWEKFSVSTIDTTYYEEGTPYLLPGGVGTRIDDLFTSYRFNSTTGTYTNDGSPVVLTPDSPGSGYRSGGGTLREYFMNSSGEWNLYRRDAQGPYARTVDTKGSTSYGFVYGQQGAYPNSGVKDGYWYSIAGETGRSGTASIGYDVVDFGGANGKFTSVFVPGDIIRIEGTSHAKEGMDYKIKSVEDYVLTFEGTLFSTGTEMASFTIYKPVPELDYICSHDNRLWGVSNKDKTIYASALGLPADFYDFDGLSVDSYAVAVGTDKDFTGICSYGDSVLCWKENVLHKILGSIPSEYYMSTSIVNGLEAGSGASMQVVNEVLYYKGIDGVYAYTGGVPQLISAAFGQHRYRYAVAGSDDVHYYISMQDVAGGWVLYVYDILRGLWIKEDNIRCISFTEQENRVLFLSENVIYKTEQDDGDEVIEWLAEFAPTYETHTTNYSLSGMLNRRDYLRLVIRVEVNGTLKVEYRTDDGAWITARHVKTDWTQIVQVPIPPLRCDKFQFRLSGTGEVTIRAIQRELTIGSTK